MARKKAKGSALTWITPLKIGYSFFGVVIKAMPDKEAYLIKIADSGVLALLPKRQSDRKWKVGDVVLATVYDIKGPWVILSQTSAQHVRRITEMCLGQMIAKRKIKVKRVATVRGAGFYKVAIESLCETSALSLCDNPEVHSCLREHISRKKISFVEYSKDTETYIINSLCPGPPESVVEVLLFPDEKRATVVVKKRDFGLFVGKNGANVSVASKLLGFEIRVVAPEIPWKPEQEVLHRWQTEQNA